MLRKIIGFIMCCIAGGLVGLMVGLIRNEDYDTINYVANLMIIFFVITSLLCFGIIIMCLKKKVE
jgi:uncharacterized membrane protein